MAPAGGGGRENDFAGLFQGHGLVTEEGSSTSTTVRDRAARRRSRAGGDGISVSLVLEVPGRRLDRTILSWRGRPGA